MSSILLATRAFVWSDEERGSCMSHTSHATAYLLTWSQVGAFVCRRGRWHERREPVAWSTIVMQLRVFQHARNCMCSNLVAASAFVLSDEERDSCMPHTSHTIACLLTCLQLGSLFCRMRRGASCMSHTSHATACLLTWWQLGAFALPEEEKHQFACPTLATQLHVF